MNHSEIRALFPTLAREVHGHPLAYFDSAATALKPTPVIDRITNHYRNEASNVHRGIHLLSSQATDYYEEARKIVAKFIGAKSDKEIIFTNGTTDSLNLLAHSYGGENLKKDDEIILSTMEHHSNIIPWQLIAKKTGAKIIECPINDLGEIELEQYKKLLNKKTKIVSICSISNTLGTINPIKEMIKLAHDIDAIFVVDAAQSIIHAETKVQELDCDFLAFSGHKAFGPTGIGVLYGKEELLNQMPPYQGGGGMIEQVAFEGSTFLDTPERFEAGTPNIAGTIGLGEALSFIKKIGLAKIEEIERPLLESLTKQLLEIDGLRIIGQASQKVSVVSFVIDDIHPHDLGMILDQQGVAVRTGHHCTGPLMKRFNVPATTRASLSIYNNENDIDRLIKAIRKAIALFKD